jgi:hypothetical protein
MEFCGVSQMWWLLSKRCECLSLIGVKTAHFCLLFLSGLKNNKIAPTKPPTNVVSGRCLKVGRRRNIIATVERERKSEIAFEERRVAI